MMVSSEFTDLTKRSIMAGAMIAFGGFANLAVGGVAGSILFSFGLISVYIYGLFLFTGQAGRVDFNVRRHLWLLGVLAGNIVGAVVVAMLARLSPLPLQDAAVKVLETRLATGWWKAGLLAIACGWIVEEAVYAYKSGGKLVPTFVGVSVFVLCGFPHCVADAFYYSLAPIGRLTQDFGQVALLYLSIVAGNYLGCNLSRFLRLK
ncbi:MAG: formate/nitrite transporter family protein [Candidatus Cryptobacteroides sp.]